MSPRTDVLMHAYSHKCMHIYIYPFRPYPKYILYNYITKNKKSYVMFDCLNMNDSDLGKITNVCIYINGYEKIPPPKYDIGKDKLIVFTKPLYLPSSQYLSVISLELNENDLFFYNYLALFILDGSIFPKMSKFQNFYSHSANDIIKCKHQNVQRSYQQSTLIRKWKEDVDFLKQEFISLIEEKMNKKNEHLISNFWPPVD
ncbi:DEAD/DEAH box ATP-dependent RNA helicase, putative [Plasmodium ovale wallikeri]|uniref:DEAD/DEAH box ATP-dependent RNA helicase, putative n=1 Tax=Plasmodium ovale wallikeri TaxID=864142 RepID=A0A1A8ZGN0_PLAOA|nr:DEAD/DEAH box ATP-dependent RNA helicase, putative [Plasmodium ovale wallikeri]SBT46763.1 DEAD/DEAH box ATP-dependent RNA helicase, putative [Plasmodium ovale wallikeri]